MIWSIGIASLIGAAFGLSMLLSAAIFPKGFRSQGGRIVHACVGATLAVSPLAVFGDDELMMSAPDADPVVDVPPECLPDSTPRVTRADAVAEISKLGDGFEEAIRRFAIARADLESEKAYGHEIGFAPQALEERKRVAGTKVTSESLWSGAISDPSLPLLIYETGGGQRVRPVVSARISGASGAHGVDVSMEGPRILETAGGSLRTWVVTILPVPGLQAGDLIDLSVSEAATTEVDASGTWFDRRDYPPSLRSVSLCVENLARAAPFPWPSEALTEDEPQREAGGLEIVKLPDDDSDTACVTTRGEDMHSFILLFLQRSGMLADASGVAGGD